MRSDLETAPRLGSGTAFEGVVTFEGALHVEGRLDGSVHALTGALLVGPNAQVRARIEVAELVIAGRVIGDVIARRRVELLPGAELEGDVTTPLLAIADGGRISGRCRTGADALGAAAAPALRTPESP